jgi:hypothetical protein
MKFHNINIQQHSDIAMDLDVANVCVSFMFHTHREEEEEGWKYVNNYTSK